MEKGKDSDPELGKAKELDVVAFGLKTFRSKYTESFEAMLQRGGRVRMIVMDPDSSFVGQREIEEVEPEG